MSVSSTWWGGVHYSEEEQVIGTWLDGKPIYQRTFVGDTVPTVERTVLASNIDTVINGFGTQVYGATGEPFQFPYVSLVSSTYFLVLRWICNPNHELIFLHQGTDRTACTDYRWTFQYTKTTD